MSVRGAALCSSAPLLPCSSTPLLLLIIYIQGSDDMERNSHKQPQAPRSTQEHPGAPRSSQEQPETARCTQEHPESPRSTQKHTKAATSNQGPRSRSEAAKEHPRATSDPGTFWHCPCRFALDNHDPRPLEHPGPSSNTQQHPKARRDTPPDTTRRS